MFFINQIEGFIPSQCSRTASADFFSHFHTEGYFLCEDYTHCYTHSHTKLGTSNLTLYGHLCLLGKKFDDM